MQKLLAVLVILLSGLAAWGCYGNAGPADPREQVPRLITLLKGPSPIVRQTAAESLGKIGDQMAEPALLVALDDADPNVRAASAWALSRLDHGVREATIERMISLLTDPVDEVKSAATLALGEMELPSHLAAQLGQLTAHPHVETRRAAALALVSTSAPAAADRLLAALQDGDAQVRQSALAALAELGDQRVVPLLKERLRADSVSGVRSEAAFRLGKLGDGTDVGELKKVAKEDSSTIVRRWAEWATEQLTLTRGSGSTP